MSKKSLFLRKRRFNIAREFFKNNEQGLLFDLSDMTAGKAGWRRNLLTYSEQFDNAAWTLVGASVTANSTLAPDGTNTADTLVESAGGTTHIVLRIPSCISSTVYTMSVYAKASTRSWIRFLENNGSGAGAFFNLTDGTIGTVLGGTPTITSVGNGWYRCSITLTTGASQTSINTQVRIATGNSADSYSGDGTSGVFLWGWQLELGTLTEYQPITDFSTEFKAAFPTHTLYQDSNGVTPCTAAGDLVGLILDQSRGGLGALGPELVTNGRFDSDTVWTKGTGWTISGGVASITNPAVDTTYIQQTISGSPNGKWFRITINIIEKGTNVVEIRLGSSASGLGVIQLNSTGQFTVFGVWTGTGNVLFIRGASTSGTYTIDNVSLREVPGNHAYQSASGARLTLGRVPFGGRRNLLTRTEEFDNNAAWGAGAVSVVANNATAPDGTTTADTVTESATTDYHRLNNSNISRTSGITYTLSVYAKLGTGTRFLIINSASAINAMAAFNLSTGTVHSTTSGSAAIQSVGSGWYRCSVTGTATSTGTSTIYFQLDDNGTDGTYAGDGTSSLLLWGAQLETGSTVSNYQRVGSTHDTTEAGQPDCWYLDTTGSKWMQTNAIDFTGTTSETRRNLLSSTESFGSPWTTGGVASATYNELGPEGRYNATTFTNIAAGGQTHVQSQIPYIPSQPYVLTFWIKAGTATTANVGVYANAAFLTTVGSVLSGPGSITGSAPQTISGLSTLEWTKVQFTFTAPASGNLDLYFYGETSGVKTGKSQSIAQFQLELGSTPTAYQPTGTDEMTVIAGVRKLSDAFRGMLVELSASWQVNNGTFAIEAPEGTPGTGYRFVSKGTASDSQTPTGITAPTTRVLSLIADISSPSLIGRANSVAIATSTVTQGTGNYGNYILYLFSRNGVDLFLNGHLFHLIIRGKTTTGSKLTGAERITARNTGITI